MICKYCGKEIRDDSNFCVFCGENLTCSNNDTVEDEKKHEITNRLLPIEIDLLTYNEFGDEHSHEVWNKLRATMAFIENGDAKAMRDLAVLYEFGSPELEIPKDYKKSAYWYYRAAQYGDSTAMYRYGKNYLIVNSEEGKLVNVEEKGCKYVLQAANMGISRAQHTIGIAYSNGWGVEKSYSKAYYYLNNAKENGENVSKDIDILMKKINEDI